MPLSTWIKELEMGNSMRKEHVLSGNNGIESTDATITFVELKDILIELSNLANKISNLTP